MRKILFVLFAILTLLNPIFGFADNSDDDSAEDKKQIYHITKDISLIPTVKIQYDKPRVVAKAVYPLIESDMATDDNIDNFNRIIDSLIQEEISNFSKQVKNNQDVQANLDRSKIKNDLNIDFDASIVNTNKNPIVSIRFTIQGYIAGMAHPYHFHRVVNYDLHNGQELTLADLFKRDSNYLTVISDYTRNALSRRLKDKEMVAQGTAPKEENFKNWNINPHGLLITFDEAQVAPYVHGTQSVIIPYAVLKKILLPDSAVSGCLLHRKRCLQNNLLTGGFIDEAANIPNTIHF